MKTIARSAYILAQHYTPKELNNKLYHALIISKNCRKNYVRRLATAISYLNNTIECSRAKSIYAEIMDYNQLIREYLDNEIYCQAMIEQELFNKIKDIHFEQKTIERRLLVSHVVAKLSTEKGILFIIQYIEILKGTVKEYDEDAIFTIDQMRPNKDYIQLEKLKNKSIECTLMRHRLTNEIQILNEFIKVAHFVNDSSFILKKVLVN